MLKRITRTLTVATNMEVLVLINKKNGRRENEGFMQGEEDIRDGATAFREIMERARAAGINPKPILQEIINAVKGIDSPRSVGICTNADVELMGKVLIEKIQQILNRYQIDRLEIGRYPDPYAMDGYTEVQIFLASSGHPYEVYHGGRIQLIELSSSVLRELHSSKHILSNLLLKLIEMTEKNNAKIKEIEELVNS
jgi:hypothetical protein